MTARQTIRYCTGAGIRLTALGDHLEVMCLRDGFHAIDAYRSPVLDAEVPIEDLYKNYNEVVRLLNTNDDRNWLEG
jgi:hypothetical protein